MLSTVNAYEPSELISQLVGTVLLTLVILEAYRGRAKTLGKEISKEIHFRPLSFVSGNLVPHPRSGEEPISKLA